MEIIIQSGPVNIYSDAYIKADVVGVLNKGDHAKLLKTYYKYGDKWDKIKTEKGVNGYILDADYFKIVIAFIKQSKASVYKEPSENSTIVTTLEKSERFKILEEIDSNGAGWLFIEDDFDDKGYIAKSVQYGLFKNRGDWFLGEAITSKNIDLFYAIILWLISTDLINHKFHFYEKYSGTIYLWFHLSPLIILILLCKFLFAFFFHIKDKRKLIDKSWQTMIINIFIIFLPSLSIATGIDLLFDLKKYFTRSILDWISIVMVLIFSFSIAYIRKKGVFKSKKS